MSDLIKQLKHIALRKRDEVSEETGTRPKLRGFIEWRAADEIERLNKRVEGLEKDRWKPAAQRTNERLRAALEETRNYTRPEFRETQSPGTVRAALREVYKIASEALKDD